MLSRDSIVAAWDRAVQLGIGPDCFPAVNDPSTPARPGRWNKDGPHCYWRNGVFGVQLAPDGVTPLLDKATGGALVRSPDGKTVSQIYPDGAGGLSWSAGRTTAAPQWDRWKRDARLNLGFLGRQWKVVDIDIEDATLVQAVRAVAALVLGDTSVRSRASTARCSLFVRCPGELNRIVLQFEEKGAVEIRGHNNYTVLAGWHVGGQEPILWDMREPPEVTLADIEAFVDALTQLGGKALRSAPRAVLAPREHAEPDYVGKWLEDSDWLMGYGPHGELWLDAPAELRALYSSAFKLGDLAYFPPGVKGHDRGVFWGLHSHDQGRSFEEWLALFGVPLGLKEALQAGEFDVVAAPPEGDKPPAPPPPADGEEGLRHVDLSDTGNAVKLMELTRGDLRYVHEFQMWLAWDRTCNRWYRDLARGKATTQALNVGEFYRGKAHAFGELAKQPGLTDEARADLEEKAKEMGRWARACRENSRRDGMLFAAQKHERFLLDYTLLDRELELFGVQNGVVDLRQAAAVAVPRDAYITRHSHTSWDPDATAPRWESFIREITGLPCEAHTPGAIPVKLHGGGTGWYVERPHLAAYLQRLAGYFLTGHAREQAMFIAWGEGSNGKNAFFDVMKELLGFYGEKIPNELLVGQKRERDPEAASPTIRKLAGVRMALASEPESQLQLAVSLVKEHTGDAQLTARGLYDTPITFNVTHKLVLLTNHKPTVDHLGPAIAGRIHLIPFNRRWNRPTEVNKDPLLPDGDSKLLAELRKEAPGILRWAVLGAKLYIESGLTPPAEVIDATTEYFADADSVGRWLSLCARCEPEVGVGATAAYAAYAAWCADEALKTVSPKAFGTAMREPKRGVQVKKMGAGMRYGLRLPEGVDFEPIV